MAATTERIFELVLRLVEAFGCQLTRVAGCYDLTAIQAKVLWKLDEPTPMGAIAGHLQCDASNVTGIVDRLEARGLVERRSGPSDRRVKQVARTAAGDELTGRLLRDLQVDGMVLDRLSPAQRTQLAELLELVVEDAPVAAGG